MSNSDGGTGVSTTPRTQKEFKLQHFNRSLTNPHLRSDHFVKSFNQMIRNEFFQNAQKRSFGCAEQHQFDVFEFPSIGLKESYNTFLNDADRQTKLKDSARIFSTRPKNVKKIVFQEKQTNSIYAGQAPVTMIFHISERVKKLSLHYQKILSKAKSSHEFVSLLSSLPLQKITSEPKEKNYSMYGTEEKSPVLTRKSPKRVEVLKQPINPFRIRHIRSLTMALPMSASSEKPNGMLNEESESKKKQIREVVNILNKKLDSIRGHGNGTALVRNLLRSFSKNQACPSPAVTDFKWSKRVPMQASDSVIAKRSDPLHNLNDRQSHITKMKNEFRETAYRNSEKSFRLLLSNKKKFPKFDFPRLTLNIELNQNHQPKSIDPHATSRSHAKNEGNFNLNGRSSSYLRLFEEGFQTDKSKENHPSKRISQLITERTLYWRKALPEKTQLDELKTQVTQKLSELQQKLSKI